MGKAIEFEFEGQNYRMVGYQHPIKGKQYLTYKQNGGIDCVMKASFDWGPDTHPMVIVERILVVHEYDGLRFEETGEKRSLRTGEWGMTESGNLGYWLMQHESFSQYTILRRVP